MYTTQYCSAAAVICILTFELLAHSCQLSESFFYLLNPPMCYTLCKNAESVIHTLFWTLDALQVALHTVPLSQTSNIY